MTLPVQKKNFLRKMTSRLNSQIKQQILSDLDCNLRILIERDPAIIHEWTEDTPNATYICNPLSKESQIGARRCSTRAAFFSRYYDLAQWVGTYESNGYLIHGKIYADFCRTKEFDRLSRIRQLGTVVPSYHTRFHHSLFTGLLMELVLRKNKFSDHDITLGIAAGLLHDIAISPYPDEFKYACGDMFDEEKDIAEVIGCSADIDSLLRSYGLKQEEVVSCIKGQYPLIGELLNSRNIDTDKVSYTVLDALEFRREQEFIVEDDLARVFSEHNKDGRMFEDYSDLSKTLGGCTDIFQLYKTVSFKDTCIYSDNPELVTAFLEIRALMFAHRYLSPANQARKAFLGEEVHTLLDEGQLTKEQLLQMDDMDFEILLRDRLTSEMYSCVVGRSFYRNLVELERHYDKSVEEVKEAAPKGSIVMSNQGFNPALETKVLMKGEIVTFGEAFPLKAGMIQSIADSCDYVGVYAKI